MNLDSDLLAQDVLLQRLAVFRGCFTIKAAETICAAQDISQNIIQHLLARLVSRGLVVQREGGDQSVYQLPEAEDPNKQECLSANRVPDFVHRNHAGYYLALAEQAEQHLRGPQQSTWFMRIEQQHANLQIALEWALKHEESHIALRLGKALWYFWQVRGHLSEGRQRLTKILDVTAAASVHRPMRVRVLGGAAVLALAQRDFSAMRSLCEEIVAIAGELNDKPSMASALIGLADAASQEGNHVEAHALLQKSLDIFTDLEDQIGISGCHYWLALLADRRGDSAVAISLLQQRLAICKTTRDMRGLAASLMYLGEILSERGDQISARTHLEQALTLAKREGHLLSVAGSLHNLGLVARKQEDHAAAFSLMRESLEIASAIGYKLGIITSLEGFAMLAASQGQPKRSLRLAGAAASARQTSGMPCSPRELETLERCLGRITKKLLEQEYAAEWSAGRAATLQEAIAYALMQDV